jgi:branched-chain amino acid aminotransferase
MPSYAFFKNKFMPLEDAKIGIMTHSFHYGTAIFEGIRGNWNAEKKQTYIFRMQEHYERLLNAAPRKILTYGRLLTRAQKRWV